MGIGRSRKISSANRMEELWEAYKTDCENQMVLTHDFSSKNSQFVSKELRKSITYTIEGFCVFAGIARSNFYETYAADERFRGIVTRMKEECEVDARKKFELQIIPPQLAPLWMSKHGYSVKTETQSEMKIQAADEMSISDKLKLLADATEGAKDLIDQNGGDSVDKAGD